LRPGTGAGRRLEWGAWLGYQAQRASRPRQLAPARPAQHTPCSPHPPAAPPARPRAQVNATPIPLGPQNPFGNAFRVAETYLDTTSAAQRLCCPEQARHWKIKNPAAVNPITREPVAYKLLPGSNVTMLAQPGSLIHRRAHFATKHLWVTPHDDEQKYPAGDHVVRGGAAPASDEHAFDEPALARTRPGSCCWPPTRWQGRRAQPAPSPCRRRPPGRRPLAHARPRPPGACARPSPQVSSDRCLGLAQWTAQDAPLRGADPVLWYSFGVTHIPRIEDFPVMPCEVVGFSLKPCGFFTLNPSNDLPPERNMRSKECASCAPGRPLAGSRL
jgi:hypothetical protein